MPTGFEIPSPESRIGSGELLPEWVRLRVADFGPVLAGVKPTWIGRGLPRRQGDVRWRR